MSPLSLQILSQRDTFRGIREQRRYRVVRPDSFSSKIRLIQQSIALLEVTGVKSRDDGGERTNEPAMGEEQRSAG